MLLTLLIILAISLGISFICSLMEACLLSVSAADTALLEARNPRLGRIWKLFRDNIQSPLAVILMINTVAHTLGASLSAAQFSALYGDRWLFVFSLGVAFVMIQWTEILPKALGVRYNRRLAPLLALPLHGAVRLLSPVVWLIHQLNRPFEARGVHEGPSTVDEIHALAQMARVSKLIEPAQEQLIAGAIGLSERPVRKFMVPRDELSLLSSGMTLDEALAKAYHDAHTRYPLADGGDPDKMVGYVNFKELVSFARTSPQGATLTSISRPMDAVGPEERASALLRRLIDTRQHIAQVRGADGKTVGVVTLEDLLEAPLIGLEGEFDQAPATFLAFGPGRFMIGGGLPVSTAATRLGVPLGGGAETLSDWVTARLGRPPLVNDVVREGGAEVTVRRVRRRKVFEASVLVGPKDAAPPTA